MQLPDHIANPDPSIYWSDNYVVFDTESTNLDKGSAINPNNRLILTVWGRDGNYEEIYNDEYYVDRVVEACEQADFIVAQNAKHDLQWLKRAGADMTKIVVWDTMIGAYVEDGNRIRKRDMRSLAKRYKLKVTKENLVDKLIKMGVCPSVIPRSWLTYYCRLDVTVTEAIFLRQRELLASLDLFPVMYTRCLLTPVLADIEFNGMHLDEVRVKEEYIKLCYELGELERQLNELTGGINPRSPKQLSEFLYEVLKFPVPKKYGKPIVKKNGTHPTDKNTVAQLKPKTKRQKLFLELKKQQGKLHAALTKNIEFFHGACVELGGVFTAAFNQTIARTHRLTSSGRPVKFDMYPKPKSVNCAA